MKVVGRILIWIVPMAVIALVLMFAGCKNPDREGPFGFTIQSNPKIKAVFSDPIFRQIGFDSNDPYSKYNTEGVGLQYYEQQDLIDIIMSAKSTIDITSPQINNLAMVEILVGLANRGVSIRIVTERSNFDFIDPTIPESTKQMLQQLIDAGVQIHTDSDDLNRLMHERYMIIDNQILLVGSSDFLCTSFSEAINNTLIIESMLTINPTIATPANVNTVMDAFVFDFEQMFVRNKFGVAKEALFKNTFEDTGTTIEVYFGPSNNVMEQIVQELNNADDILFYCIQQFTNGTMLNNMAVMNQNIQVSGIIDSITNVPQNILTQIGAVIYDGMGYNSMNHKFIVIDFPLDIFDYEYPSPSNLSDPVVITGSPNWNESNFSRNDEDLVIVHDLATAYRYALVEFPSNSMGAAQVGLIYGECRSAVNNVPLECSLEIRVERKGFLPGIPPDEDPPTVDSDPETGWYSTTVPGGLTDVTLTEAPGQYLIPDYIAGNELLFPGGSQEIFWYLPLKPSGSGSR